MGVQGLWKLLESTGKPVNPETLEGKILACMVCIFLSPHADISIWLNQAVKGMRDRDGNSVQNAHLLTLFHRLCKLLFFRIRPIFVFDGDTPLLKKETVVKRRQRKEEMNRESKETNEKFLKTFLKRQAIRAALGEKSEEKFPSISTVRREEVDDMFVLPALEERERNSSDEEVEKEWEEAGRNQGTWQEMFENPNSMDIDSEEFRLLPAEMKHDILKDMKEFSKRCRTMFEKPPERSTDFSQYQLAGLLHRNQLNDRIKSVEKDMNKESSAGVAEEYRGEGGEGHSVEARRLMSEDSSHYILIKGAKKSEKAAEKQPAVLPWAGSSRRVRGRPEPLWRPVSEDGTEEEPPSPPFRQDTAEGTPSPRTLKAIQAAMMSSSSDEEGGTGSQGAGTGSQRATGELSPRTLLAIQRALTEDHSVPETLTDLQSPELHQHAPPHRDCVIISSSEEEEEEVVEAIKEKKGGFSSNILSESAGLGHSTGQRERESVELGESVGFRGSSLDSRQDLCLTPQNIKDSESSDSSIPDVSQDREESVSSTLTNLLNGGSSCEEPHPSAIVLCTPDQQEVTTMTRSVSENAQQPPRVVTPQPALSPEDGSQKERVEEVKSEESNSEESFVEVSEGETEEEVEPGDVPLKMGEDDFSERTPGGEEEGEAKYSPEVSLGSGPPPLDNETEQEVRPPQEPPSAPASSEWAHINMEELVQLESSLQSQQSSLKAQKQQQERFSATVTGQMCLESQELLQLFGVPFLVAPMEAEAQCAALDRTDHTHGTITDDSDIWLFGGRHVYKNFFSHNKYVEHYQYLDLHTQLGLDRTKLINLAYLLGSDYTEGITGVGYVTGMEILNEFPGPGMEPLTSFSEWLKEAQENKKLVANPRDTKVKKKLRELQLHPGFPNPAVAQAYLQPAVDHSSAAFTWGRPHLENIKEYPLRVCAHLYMYISSLTICTFCLSRFGWSGRKTEEVLQPVMKQLNTQQTQLRIDSFFRLEQQERQAIQSQRLRRAVTCLKRKEQGEEEEEEEKVVESRSPAKAKKGKTEEAAETRGPVVWAGGFLGSGDTSLSLRGEEEGRSVDREEKAAASCSPQPKISPQPKLSPLRAGRSSSSSSSTGDDSDPGDKVTMVTARSVFQIKGRGGRRKTKRKP
ncbi:hypothetical protein AAFF_G00193970 [Aldrovandia affinis]|uniref:Uncharacterized protein n=1 Tax=Aldrovandia affinis TaxID=143900 RepID=A0AAD7SY68_9TELE|nr:hypothetical protein AAFF_G00193970 [Aldrovandia affinis]